MSSSTGAPDDMREILTAVNQDVWEIPFPNYNTI